MASGDTKTQQYLDVAANGTRADLPSDTCCETRTQTLIRGVAERIMDVEDEVERLENNPDVVDIVATYAALQAYPTSQLTDKDVVRVLQDETHDGDSTYYRWSTTTQTWTYIGESKQYTDFVGTDGTAGGQNGLVPAPVATDAGKFLNANGSWEEVQAGATYTAGDGIDISAQDVISATNTGKAKVLTTADYNANSSDWTDTDPANFNCVVLVRLPNGFYTKEDSSVVVYRGANTATGMSVGETILVSHYSNTSTGLLRFYNNGSNSAPRANAIMYAFLGESQQTAQRIINSTDVVDNLTSYDSSKTLSADQGRILKNLVDSIATRGAGAPTASTAGQVGTLYEDTTNGDLYICTDATNPYVWEAVGAGGSGPTVVQTTGTSTTDVMSQNAVTSMVFADNSTNTIEIGMNARNDNNATSVAIGWTSHISSNAYNSIAIGKGSEATAQYSIALGGATANVQGVMAIGTSASSATQGYNNSNYRLLTGLYDPQSDHDAATKGYVDGLVGNVASALNTINNGTGA